MQSGKPRDFEESASMIEQRIFLAMLEYLLDVLIVTICFSATKMKFNYITLRHERAVYSISSKRDLKEKTERVTMEVTELLDIVRGRSDIIKTLLDQAFERALAECIALGYVREQRIEVGDRSRFEYSITERGLEFYIREIRPVFAGFLKHLHSIDLGSSEAKGLEKYT
jgi:hypothetical protein